jgi:hypothetical protein
LARALVGDGALHGVVAGGEAAEEGAAHRIPHTIATGTTTHDARESDQIATAIGAS